VNIKNLNSIKETFTAQKVIGIIDKNRNEKTHIPLYTPHKILNTTEALEIIEREIEKMEMTKIWPLKDDYEIIIKELKEIEKLKEEIKEIQSRLEKKLLERKIEKMKKMAEITSAAIEVVETPECLKLYFKHKQNFIFLVEVSRDYISIKNHPNIDEETQIPINKIEKLKELIENLLKETNETEPINKNFEKLRFATIEALKEAEEFALTEDIIRYIEGEYEEEYQEEYQEEQEEEYEEEYEENTEENTGEDTGENTAENRMYIWSA
jgi:hypothetical protein